ncbi:MAG: DUF192 domain-containing protein [Acidimicrobiia bacterium]|nr:DUF192 domain-containing protein [Acidimicrobiia bacterium]
MIDSPLPRSAARIGAAVISVLFTAALLGSCGDDTSGDDSTADPPTRSSTEGDPGDPEVTSPSAPSTSTTDPGLDCPTPGGVLTQFTSRVITVVAPDGDTVDRCVAVADDRARRASGLMEVRELEPFDGMLFAYASPSSSGYWMRNTPLPLSIAWVSSAGDVVATADMEPCMDESGPCPTYPPNAEFLWALEVPQGELDEFGLVEGATLDVSTLPAGVD